MSNYPPGVTDDDPHFGENGGQVESEAEYQARSAAIRRSINRRLVPEREYTCRIAPARNANFLFDYGYVEQHIYKARSSDEARRKEGAASRVNQSQESGSFRCDGAAESL